MEPYSNAPAALPIGDSLSCIEVSSSPSHVLLPIRLLPVVSSSPSSIAISSCSKEIYAGYSHQKLAVWIKPKSPDDVNFAVLEKDGFDIFSRQQNPAAWETR